MSQRAGEVTDFHTRLLKCALEVDDARAYWKHAEPTNDENRGQIAFDDFWFGARSLARVKVLITNFRARFDCYPEALRVLRLWEPMDPDSRQLVCHWHLQLSDPLYRAFSGELLPTRRDRSATITRDVVLNWIPSVAGERWTTSTRIQFASKLLSCAYAAGLVGSNRDPRPLQFPRVTDDALSYLVYLLRALDFDGSLLVNPYLRSVGLDGPLLESRLRGLEALDLARQGEIIDLGWRYETLWDWARATVCKRALQASEAA